MRASKIAHDVLLGVAPFLVRDNHAPLCSEHGHTAWHGAIVSKSTVAMQFDPVCEAAFDVVKSERSLTVTRDLNPLPCRQIAVNVPAGFSKLCLKFFHRRPKIHIMLGGMTLQILQPPFEFKDRLFKIERLPVH